MAEFLQIKQNAESTELAGRDLNAEFHRRRRNEAVRQALEARIDALAAALEENGEAIEAMLPAMQTLMEGVATVKQQAAVIVKARGATPRVDAATTTRTRTFGRISAGRPF